MSASSHLSSNFHLPLTVETSKWHPWWHTHSQYSWLWKPHINLSVWLKAIRHTPHTVGSWGMVKWLEGEDDQGSLLNYRLGLCTELHPKLWDPGVLPAADPGHPATAHQSTSMRPPVCTAVPPEMWPGLPASQHFKTSMTRSHKLAAKFRWFHTFLHSRIPPGRQKQQL